MPLPIRRSNPPTLTQPPEVYSQVWMRELVRQLQGAINDVYGLNFPITGLPTSATGLKQGQMYIDASGFVRVVL
jgi:hypothetical protein